MLRRKLALMSTWRPIAPVNDTMACKLTPQADSETCFSVQLAHNQDVILNPIGPGIVAYAWPLHQRQVRVSTE